MPSLRRFLRRHPAGIVIVALWLFMMGRLVRMHYGNTALANLASGSSVTVHDLDDWMGIYYKGDKIGYTHTSFRPEGEGLLFEEQTSLEITAQGFPMNLAVKSRARIGHDFVLESFVFHLRSGLVETRVSGTVEEGVLALETETSGVTSTRRIPLGQAPTMTGSLPALLAGRTLTEGERFTLPVFDPATLSQRDMEVVVQGEDFLEMEGEMVPCHRLVTRYAGMSMDLWVGDGGRILQEATPMGWTMIRESRQDALTRGWKEGARVDLARATSIRPEGAAIPAPRDLGFLSVQLPLRSTEDLDLAGGRQRLQGGYPPLVYVTRETVDEGKAPPLPVRDPALAPYLEPEMLVQSDHPEIVRQARAIVGGETNSLRAARLILAWVHENLEKRAVASLPNAADVLRTRVGDCNEHTVLYVALARAVGLPARTNVGLVLAGDRFYYHAWPEVHAGGWITVDPVFDQLPADATHIRLLIGGIDRQVAIVRLLGELQTLKVLAAR